jgi:hypothetical protein
MGPYLIASAEPTYRSDHNRHADCKPRGTATLERVQEPARDFRRQSLAGFFGRLGEMDILDDQPGI